MISKRTKQPCLARSLAAAALLSGSAAVSAALVSLDLTGGTGYGETSFQRSAGGVTATFSNSSNGQFECVDSGLPLGNLDDSCTWTQVHFDVSFDQDIALVSYRIADSDLSSAQFHVTGPSVSSLNNPPSTGGFVGGHCPCPGAQPTDSH
jgi:hypothetical protein